jgi:glycopeptide antibiotics resistance protein
MSVEELRRPPGAGGAGGPRGRRGHAMPAALFTVYLVLLAWTVMFKLEAPYLGSGDLREIKLVPFVASACNGASAPSEVVANVLLFLPFGLYLGLLAPAWPWWRVAATVAGTSIGFEVAQYVLAVGSSDVTDVITNTGGGLAGLALLVIARRRLGARTVGVMTRICSVMTVIGLLLAAVVVASPLGYGPQPDVMVSMNGAPGPVTGEAARGFTGCGR